LGKPEIQADVLQKWLTVTQKLYSTLELDESIRSTVDVALEITGMKRGILLTCRDTGEFEVRHAQTDDGKPLEPADTPDVAAMMQNIPENNAALVKRSADGCSVLFPLLTEHPAMKARKLIGAIYCDSNEAAATPDPNALDLLRHHIGPALETVILYDWATRDPQTQVYKRHYFNAVAVIEWRRTLRHKHPVSILKIDLDTLRDYNDRYGRKDGDMVLLKTAEILKDICRTEDVIARYEEDEFAVLLAETDAPGARLVAGRIAEEVPLLLTREPERPVTVSIGVAVFPRCSVSNIYDLMKLADVALQQAKQAGGKRAFIYEPSLSTAHKKVF